jgi:hypothetical protein
MIKIEQLTVGEGREKRPVIHGAIDNAQIKRVRITLKASVFWSSMLRLQGLRPSAKWMTAKAGAMVLIELLSKAAQLKISPASLRKISWDHRHFGLYSRNQKGMETKKF